MKKKIAILMAAMLLLATAAGCGQRTNNETGNTSTSAKTDASQNYGTADYTPDQVNMSKVDGKALKSSSDKAEYSGELSNADVTIEDVKVIDYDGTDVAVVSFKYKNTGTASSPFTGRVKTAAYQDGDKLQSLVVTGVEGVTMLALSENVEKGDTITVQTAYKLNDTSTPITVEVTEVDMANATSDGLTKTFEF